MSIHEERIMTNRDEAHANHDAYRLLFAIAVAVAAAGCGDNGIPGSTELGLCEAMCENGDACPSLYAEADCVSDCQRALDDAAELGGTCTGAMEDLVVCSANLSCSDLTARTLNPNHIDECSSFERELSRCVPDLPGKPSPSHAQEPATSEVELACQSFCESAGACGVRFNGDCVEACVGGFDAYVAVSTQCAQSYVDSFDCYSNMVCAEITDRVDERGGRDTCTSVDDYTIRVCNP